MSEEIIKALSIVEARIPHIKFIDNILPRNMPPNETITLYREQLERFRLSYEILLETLAEIVGVDYHKLNVLDLLGYYYKKAKSK